MWNTKTSISIIKGDGLFVIGMKKRSKKTSLSDTRLLSALEPMKGLGRKDTVEYLKEGDG